MKTRPPVVGFSGPSGVGKTTLLEKLITELGRRGLRLGVVKHASCRIEVDRPGKDSYRLYEAGAHAVTLTSPDQVVTFQRRSEGRRLADSLAALPEDLDVVLVEGFLSEPIPRYVVLPPGGPDERGFEDSPDLIRVIEAPPRAEDAQPEFAADLIASIADEIAARAAKPRLRSVKSPS